MILADGIPHTDFHVINLQPDKEYNFRVRAVNKYGCSEPTSLVQLRRRAGKFSLYAEKYVNDQIVMMPEIFVIYVLGHKKKKFWFSDNGFQKKGKVSRVFIFCFYFQSNMGRVFIYCFYFQRFKT